MASTVEEKTRSSLLSDCTNGLVGAFMTKLEDKEEDIEGARYLALSISTGGNLEFSWNDEKVLGGDVASHSCVELYIPSLTCTPLELRGPSVKSPL